MRNNHVFRIAGAAALAVGMLTAQTTTPPATNTQQIPAFLQNRIQRAAIVLDLSGQQQSQIQDIVNRAWTQAQPLIQEMKSNQQQIRSLITSGAAPASFDQQIQTLSSRQGQLIGQLINIRSTAMANAWTVLTPAQQQKAMQLHEFGFGGRGGHMHGGGWGG
jgi:Spy/CpxP family protein refolding chaperone